MAKITRVPLKNKGRFSYRVDYYDLNGKRRKERFKTHHAASIRLAEVVAGRETGELRAKAADVRFEDLVRKWRLAASPQFRKNTARQYDWILSAYLLPALGKRKLRTITLEVCEQLRADTHRLAAGGRSATDGRTTANRAVVLLKQIMTYAERHRYVAQNPARHVRSIPRPADDTQERVVLGPEELRKLFANAHGMYKPLLMCAALTGLRSGELLGLQWGDVDWSGKRVHVRRQMVRGEVATLKTPAASRSVPMPDQLVLALKTWKLACPKGDGDLVFPDRNGGPYKCSSQLLISGLHPALRRAGLPKITLHALRHGYASTLLAAGVGIKTVQTLMGHATVQMTLNVYAHALPGDDAGVTVALSGKVFGNFLGTSAEGKR
jgi:integrase